MKESKCYAWTLSLVEIWWDWLEDIQNELSYVEIGSDLMNPFTFIIIYRGLAEENEWKQ
jgi:hypothetical protein